MATIGSSTEPWLPERDFEFVIALGETIVFPLSNKLQPVSFIADIPVFQLHELPSGETSMENVHPLTWVSWCRELPAADWIISV